jgi:hypothetical protein
LPSLTFLGHWPALRLTIPGTSSYVAVPLFGHDGDSVGNSSETDEHAHEQHCHANAASCTDVPFTGASAFALMTAAVGDIARQATRVLIFSAGARVPAGVTLSPSLRPPNVQA